MLCGDKICRDCCLDITKEQIERKGWISVVCSKCNTPVEFDFNMLDTNHHLQVDIHQIKKKPKLDIIGPPFTCDNHDNQLLQKKCKLDEEFCCIDCLDDHDGHI